jgi:uncharacterized membrane protein YkvA (DUF1232 family)
MMSNNEEQIVNEDTALIQNEDHPGFFGELWQQVRLVYKLLLDPEVPIYLKVLPFAALVYLVFPFDFLPDFIPGLGQLDDITILIVGAKMFIDMAPNQVVERHIQGMRGQGDNVTAGDEQTVEGLYADDPDVIEGVVIEDIE